MLQEIRFQVQVLKPCKYVQESSIEVLKPCKSIQESSIEVLDFKTRQLASIEILKQLKPVVQQLAR